jgi:hypothetical protein
MMSLIAELLTMSTALTGVYAANLWNQASKVPIAPTWLHDGGVEPGDQHLSMRGWIDGIQNAFNESAILNRRAAQWTAISAFLAAIAAAAGYIA